MNQLTNMATTVGRLLKDREETVGVSESSTGGLVSAALLSIPGASAYFVGGATNYTHTAREAFIGFSLDDHPGMRSATEPFVMVGAEAVCEVLGTTWGVAEAGAAGPTDNRYGDNAGHSCIAIHGPVCRVFTIETGDNDREANMWRFAEEVLKLLEDALKDAG